MKSQEKSHEDQALFKGKWIFRPLKRQKEPGQKEEGKRQKGRKKESDGNRKLKAKSIAWHLKNSLGPRNDRIQGGGIGR